MWKSSVGHFTYRYRHFKHVLDGLHWAVISGPSLSWSIDFGAKS
jgi:hypothetical protein